MWVFCLTTPPLFRDNMGFLSDHTSFGRDLKQLQVFFYMYYIIFVILLTNYFCPFIIFIYAFVHFQSGIERIFNGARLKNSEAMEVILKAAISKAIGGCVQLSHMKVI